MEHVIVSVAEPAFLWYVDNMRAALGQFNPCVGDIAGNVAKMRAMYAAAAGLGADVLIFPEMCVCGYPPEDLLLKKHFLDDNHSAVEQLATDCPKMTLITGFAEADGQKSFNSLAVLGGGRIQKVYRKCILPNYGVFDEQRYFQPGNEPVVIDVEGANVVLTICEDIWQLERLDEFLKDTGRKDVIVNISASPFHVGKREFRWDMLGSLAKKYNVPLVFANQVGGNDSVLFDGTSAAFNREGKMVAQGKEFEEDLVVLDLRVTEPDSKKDRKSVV